MWKLRHYKKAIQKIGLLPQEKRDIYNRLLLFIKENPVIKTNSQRLIKQGHKNNTVGVAKLKIIVTKKYAMPVILALILILGGGTSALANQALPGDFLYPIKVNVNEGIRTTLTFSSQAQAQWDVERAQKRLEEAEQLAAQNRLNEQVQTELEARFQEASDSFEKNTQEVEAKNKTQAMLELRTSFEAALKAHEQVLSDIASENQQTKESIDALLAKVRARVDDAEHQQEEVQAHLETQSQTSLQILARNQQNTSGNKITEVEKFLAKLTLATSTQAQTTEKMTSAHAAYDQGTTQLENEQFAQAITSFQLAFRSAQEAQIIAAVNARIEIKLDSFERSHSESNENKNEEEHVSSTPEDIQHQEQEQEREQEMNENASSTQEQHDNDNEHGELNVSSSINVDVQLQNKEMELEHNGKGKIDSDL